MINPYTNNNLNLTCVSFQKKTILILFIITWIFLWFLSYKIIPYQDSYYYWEWSRHLALSYFDGPPLIAYVLKFYSWLFNNTIFAINFLGLTSIFIILFFIYKSANLLFNPLVAWNTCLIWLFSTPVLRSLFLWVSYDNLLMICWAILIYFILSYLKRPQNRVLYYISIFSGLLILSKYTAIILLLAILTFALIMPQQRILFKNKHFYFSISITFMFSLPILIWNYLHNWESFYYQFYYHLQLHEYRTTFFLGIFKYLIKVIKHLDILFLLPLYAFIRYFKKIKHNPSLLFLYWISFFFFLFFMLISLKNTIPKHWLTPLTISLSILSTYLFIELRLKKLYFITVFFYITLSLYYLVANGVMQKFFDEDFYKYALIQKANVYLPTLPATHKIFTTNWQTASMLAFWLNQQPFINTIACHNGTENQYLYWKKNITSYSSGIYIDFKDNAACMAKYFTQCSLLKVLKAEPNYVGFDFRQNGSLFIYTCKN